ncbi:MAG: PDZ domain-containing protein [Eubacterium sp.]|nr:PDZ domain-containing protein [Eubacterium sp.]
MNKKVSLGVTISLIAVACAITFVLTMTVSLNMYNSMVSGIQERENIYNKIREIDSFVRASSIYDIEEETLINGIMNGYIAGTSDEYARYYTAEEYYRLQQEESGVIIGTGMETQISGQYLEVTYVYEGSPAEIEGIQVGDRIVAVNGQSLLEYDTETAQNMLLGEDGTRVSVTMQDPDGTQRSAVLIRQQIEIQSVHSDLINGYAYISISTFNELTAAQFIEEIEKYEAQSVLGYVFDVRGCSRGIITPLEQMLNKLLPAGIIATDIEADGTETNLVETDGSSAIEKPMAVLVDNGTACVAELFAASLRDFAGASLVGQFTAGKSELQTTQSFKDGSAVSVSTSRVKPARSDIFTDTGLIPDYDVEAPPEQVVQIGNPDNDFQLQRALEVVAAQ